MLARLARLLLVVVTVGAFLGATVVQAAPTDQPSITAMKMSMTSGTMAHGMNGGPAPCNNKMPMCSTDLGCAFLVGIPTPQGSTSRRLVWQRVTYATAPPFLHGFSLKPDLGPPIRDV
jgi:hypothetical protein